MPWALNRFFAKIAPKLCIILETELWPNVLLGCQARQIPVVLANAHLSERSVKGYQKISPITKAMLGGLTAVAAQSQLDADRFLAIGLDPKKLSVTGNIKFDVSYADKKEHLEQALTWKKNLGARSVWTAASTHPGEEVLVLEAFKIIQKTVPGALLILVPRHPERFKSIEALVKQQGFEVITRSSGLMPEQKTEIFLGDTMGELLFFYQASDIAFVGGSLVPIGGHNLLEPAALGIPIITGSYLHNYVDISDLLIKAGGMISVADREGLAKTVIHWFNNRELRLMIGKNAYQVVQNNTGTIKKISTLINQLLLSSDS
jgi:3-deoxy-D-manno-octulosonic-acid transferase